MRAALKEYEKLGRDGRGRVAAAQPVRAGGVLPRGPGRGVEQPGPLRRRALRPPHEGEGRPDRHVREVARRGLRRGGAAADHARHLRPLERLQGRLLREGAEGPPADQERLRRGVRGVRRGRWARRRRRPAFKIGEKADDPLAMYLSDIYTIVVQPGRASRASASRAGSRRPGCRSACNCSAPPFEEEKLLRVGPDVRGARPTGTPAGRWCNTGYKNWLPAVRPVEGAGSDESGGVKENVHSGGDYCFRRPPHRVAETSASARRIAVGATPPDRSRRESLPGKELGYGSHEVTSGRTAGGRGGGGGGGVSRTPGTNPHIGFLPTIPADPPRTPRRASRTRPDLRDAAVSPSPCGTHSTAAAAGTRAASATGRSGRCPARRCSPGP